MTEHSQEYLERKKLQEGDLKNMREKHKLHMKELEYIRETDRIKHEQGLERGRIKGAEIRKHLERKKEFYRV